MGSGFVDHCKVGFSIVGRLSCTAKATWKETCILEWTTSPARYSDEPSGIAALDPQLICYSRMRGMDTSMKIEWRNRKKGPPSLSDGGPRITSESMERTLELLNCRRPQHN
jgi:hypothetical protein